MNITIGLDELRAHERMLNTWADDRCNFTIKHLRDHVRKSFTPYDGGEQIDISGVLKEWDSTHPKPKLIPNV